MTELKSITVKNVNFYVREGTLDEMVVKEVFNGEYNRLNITTDDIVVDLGLNIGSFTLYALSKGAKYVESYEAEPDNFELAMKNLSYNTIYSNNYSLNNNAVVGNDDETRVFYTNGKKNKGMHSLFNKRGRIPTTVRCVNINSILEKVAPTVLKLDIEGGEYECLKAIKSFDGIRELIFEYHPTYLDDTKTHSKYYEIIDLLHSNFSHVETIGKITDQICIIYCSK